MSPLIFQTFAKYNAWMNENVYSACATIPDAQRKADMRAFFKSIHGTLNHILVGDTIWLARFKGEPLPDWSLNSIVHEDFDALWAARRAKDQDITAFAAGLTEDWLSKPFTFTSKAVNKTFTKPAHVLVMQIFNHQTHHRGQVTTLMMQCGVDPGSTDIPMMPA